MCLAVPMQVIETDRFSARCEARGVTRDVSLVMLHEDSVVPGDYLMVHLGHALQKMSPEEAEAAWALYDEILAASG